MSVAPHEIGGVVDTVAGTVKTNNERLRELVQGAGLSQPVALIIFNRGLGPAAYSLDTWKAFLVNPESKKFRPLKDELLAHAEKAFTKLQKAARNKGTSTLY